MSINKAKKVLTDNNIFWCNCMDLYKIRHDTKSVEIMEACNVLINKTIKVDWDKNYKASVKKCKEEIK